MRNELKAKNTTKPTVERTFAAPDHRPPSGKHASGRERSTVWHGTSRIVDQAARRRAQRASWVKGLAVAPSRVRRQPSRGHVMSELSDAGVDRLLADVKGERCRCWKCTANRPGECVAHRNNEHPMVVVQRVAAGHNSLPRDLTPGETVWRFVGPTYGCVSWREVAISLAGTHTYPFHGVPVEAVEVAP